MARYATTLMVPASTACSCEASTGSNALSARHRILIAACQIEAVASCDAVTWALPPVLFLMTTPTLRSLNCAMY